MMIFGTALFGLPILAVELLLAWRGQRGQVLQAWLLMSFFGAVSSAVHPAHVAFEVALFTALLWPLGMVAAVPRNENWRAAAVCGAILAIPTALVVAAFGPDFLRYLISRFH